MLPLPVFLLILSAVVAVPPVLAKTSRNATGHDESNSNAQPHIIFILADDLGWNDVSFHGSYQIPTPNLDELAYSGVMLTNYYVQPICTPTRSALMTGKYPIHTAMWHGVIIGPEPWGLGLNETILPQLMKQQGYSTHMVGKWHLGFFSEEYTPSQRGFDSYYGYYNGKGDYWTHYDSEVYSGFDFHMNGSVYKSTYGQYSTNLFTQRAEDVIASHNKSKPLFLYFAHQAVHSGNDAQHALEAPKEYYDRFPNITDENRRMFAAMVAVMDESVGNVTRALKQAGLYDNSVIIFSTDNGGPAHGFDFNHANNYPLRGVKLTLWEGGVRGTAFVHSNLLKKTPRISHDMLHVSDWMPMIYGLAGGDVSTLKDLDGYDIWPTISLGQKSPRSEILLNIDTEAAVSALRMGDLKIINGDVQRGKWSGWYEPEGLPPHYVPPPPPASAFAVHCPTKPSNASTNCNPFEATCLYNITHDPCEFYNIADWNQDIVDSMTKRLDEYKASMVPARNKPIDPNANPALHGGYWVPWVKTK
ncbi:arylsulfatase I-like [Patiria miniata]|uniref:Sulfatase N-terminal domain-containing protein n=1 Tax=Patiria miniata TaxID=46514 RepID=A0A913ZC46_PATMI|nr:arylsulfatase I-like [Patiria miniata]